MSLRRLPSCLAMVLTAALLGACDARTGGPSAPAEIRRTPVTVGSAERRNVQVLEASVGHLETPAAPAVAAETPGRVKEIRVSDGVDVVSGTVLAVLDDRLQRIQRDSAQAELERLSALLTNQNATVRRLRDLVLDNSASQSLYDEAEAQQQASRRDSFRSRRAETAADRSDFRRAAAGSSD